MLIASCHTICCTGQGYAGSVKLLRRIECIQNTAIMRRNTMPRIFLSPSTQEWNTYVNGGNEEQYMNLLADALEPYLLASGISFVRNDPDRNVLGAIRDSNAGYYDVHLALHTNAAPESLAGQLRGIDVYYSPVSYNSERLATIMANNFKSIYPLPQRSNALATTSLGEVTQTRAVAVLAEIGYHDNPEDVAWIKGNLQPIAANIAQSLADYFGIPFNKPSGIRTGIVTADGSALNLRGYPSMEGSILGSIPDGSAVQIYGAVENWYVVSYDGQLGYANGDFITLTNGESA